MKLLFYFPITALTAFSTKIVPQESVNVNATISIGIANGNWTKWSTIQEVIVRSHNFILILRERLLPELTRNPITD